MGEAPHKALAGPNGAIALDTFGGRIHVEWDPAAAVTPLGQLPFFIEFLKVSGVFEAWVAECPLAYHSNHASDKRAVLATVLLSILAGHRRYAHITAIRHDGIHPELLGVAQLVSEDAVRRALARIDASSGVAWFDRHLAKTTQPLLTTPWILDLDATVKCLYGKQDGAVVGYNPKKPGRPLHSYHSAVMATTRLAFAVDVRPGNETAPLHSMPGIWAWLDALPKEARPALLRGDVAFGNESVLREAEVRNQPYLTKLRLTNKVKALIKTLFRSTAWEAAGHGWEGVEDTLRLSGWSRTRRVVVLRRPLTGELLMTEKDDDQEHLAFIESDVPTKRYEYAVLVTSTPYEILALAQLYRERADAENTFDELKNQWGWGGFTTQDLALLPAHGTDGGARLQLVDAVRAARPATQALRGDLQSAAVAAWRRHAHASRGTNAPHDYQPARQAIGHPSRTDQLGGLSPDPQSHCGAVDRGRTSACDAHPCIRHMHAFNSGPSDRVDLKNCADMTR